MLKELLTFLPAAKAQKGIYSKLIYDEIRAMNPPGRFLKQDPKTKLWSDIGEKKALDKTRQALREGAPELLKELEAENAEEENDIDFGDDLAPLMSQRHANNPLASSLMGNISLGSFSLGSIDPSNSDRIQSTPPVPSQVEHHDNMFTPHGANAILAAAAQLQVAQQSVQNANFNAQFQFWKNQVQDASRPNDTSSFLRGTVGNTAQYGAVNLKVGNVHDFNDYSAILSATQANNRNIALGSDEVSALLAAIHNGATNLSGEWANGAYLQLAQQISAQNISLDFNSNAHIAINNNNIFNNSDAFCSNRNNNQFAFRSNHTNHSGIQEESFNVSVPLKSLQACHEDTITTTIPLKGEAGCGQFSVSAPINQNSQSVSNTRGGGLSSSFTRRTGLKNSFTRRPNSHRHLNMEVANSLMSIESLTLDDIESTFTESVISNVFEDESDVGKGATLGHKEKQPLVDLNGRGPYDMSEVSDLGFEDGREINGEPV